MKISYKSSFVLYSAVISCMLLFQIVFCVETQFFKFYSFSSREVKKQADKPRILLFSANPYWGGAPEHVLELYKSLLKKNIDVCVIVPDNSMYHAEFSKAKLDHYVFDFNKTSKYPDDPKAKPQFPDYQCMYDGLYAVCLDFDPDIIHINDKTELKVVSDVTNKLKKALIAQYHEAGFEYTEKYKDIDAFVCVSPRVFKHVKSKGKAQNIKFVELIAPFFNDEKLLNFKPSTQSREEFFKKNFDLDLRPLPLLCVIANLYHCKNHEVLVRAVDVLTYKYKTFVQIVCVGLDNLDRKSKLEKMAQDFGVQDYIKFLGFSRDVPEILYYSDIKILPSLRDSFGIVLLEAALMGTPVILSKAADSAGFVVKDGETGLIFDPTDPWDLALKIKTLIDDQALAKKLAENFYSVVLEKFSTEVSVKKMIGLYDKVYKLTHKKASNKLIEKQNFSKKHEKK